MLLSPRMFSFLGHLSTRDSTVGNGAERREDGCCSHALFLFLFLFLFLLPFSISLSILLFFFILTFSFFAFLFPVWNVPVMVGNEQSHSPFLQYRRGYTRPPLITAETDD